MVILRVLTDYSVFEISVITAPDQSLCQNVTCPNNSQCLMVDDEASCVCDWPYIDAENVTASNRTDETVCKS